MTEQPTLILVDVSCIAYRSLHAIGGEMSHAGKGTAVHFGIFRLILEMRELFDDCQFGFAFDGGYELRRRIAPEYKLKREMKERTEEEIEERKDLYKQIKRLYQELLPQLGFRNIWRKRGFEADDLIASAAQHAGDREVVIVSSDHDLYQLLSSTTSIWNPAKRQLYSEEKFRNDFGIAPEFWSRVKAWAGCTSDNLEGIKGVGEKTAIRFITGTLPGRHKVSKAFAAAGAMERFVRNLRVTDLPFQGCPTIRLVDDELSEARWERVCERLGITTLAGHRRDRRTEKKKEKARGFGLFD